MFAIGMMGQVDMCDFQSLSKRDDNHNNHISCRYLYACLFESYARRSAKLSNYAADENECWMLMMDIFDKRMILIKQTHVI